MTILALVFSYLLGSVPTGLWLGRWLRGIDIREHGSKNIGATNTMRVLGKRLGAAALLGDAAKGAIPVLFLSRMSDWPHAPLVCGIAAVTGHLFPIFLKFKGGKGVATSAGTFLALCPIPTLIAAVAFGIAVALTRMVSLGSIIAAVSMTAAVYLLPDELISAPGHLLPPGPALQAVVTMLALLIVVKHRSNIVRIVHGRENRI